VQEARYTRLISWTSRRGSEQFIYNWNWCGSRVKKLAKMNGQGSNGKKRKTDGNTSCVKGNMHTIEIRLKKSQQRKPGNRCTQKSRLQRPLRIRHMWFVTSVWLYRWQKNLPKWRHCSRRTTESETKQGVKSQERKELKEKKKTTYGDLMGKEIGNSAVSIPRESNSRV
jgi:hypothetical protein